ncbi:MAG TPA: methyltransferase domain-containing protein, partial [Anaerolineae bacterium]|nr:methyltransferase domain-containing protein [Anaerolineae bacterium]
MAGWEGLQRLTGVMRPGGLELTERALRASRLSAGSRVLDVGCGAGASLALLAQWNLVGVGVDVMPLVGQPGIAGGVPRLVQAGGQRLPLRERSFDAVLAECSLSLMPVREALAEFARVLRPGGRLLLSDLYLRRPEQAPALRALAL